MRKRNVCMRVIKKGDPGFETSQGIKLSGPEGVKAQERDSGCS